jgi:hypothetical protein
MLVGQRRWVWYERQVHGNIHEQRALLEARLGVEEDGAWARKKKTSWRKSKWSWSRKESYGLER